MRRVIWASIALSIAIVPASAEHRYDRKLEQAAMRIVAEKIGDIRGGFSYRQKLQFVVAQDALSPNPVSPDAGSQDAGPAQKPDANVSPSVIAPMGRPKS